MKATGLRARRSADIRPPKGFDITLLDVVETYKLNSDELYKLGELTATRGIANARIGNEVFYRRAQVERIFNRNA